MNWMADNEDNISIDFGHWKVQVSLCEFLISLYVLFIYFFKRVCTRTWVVGRGRGSNNPKQTPR